MNPFQLIWFAPLLFFCLWTALLARLKGYSAACWFFGGGVIGVVILCALPSVMPTDRDRKRNGSFFGLVVSGVSITVAGLFFKAFDYFRA